MLVTCLRFGNVSEDCAYNGNNLVAQFFFTWDVLCEVENNALPGGKNGVLSSFLSFQKFHLPIFESSRFVT